MSTPPPIRVLIADDHRLFAESLGLALEADPRVKVVGYARNGREAAKLAVALDPDVVLMDLDMPLVDGIEATRAIHARDAGQHVVIYTGSDEYDDVARADAAGAVGFLHKEALTSPDLADALHVLHANYVNSVPDPD
jgi:DNA-binding NarL/FixJ family response regulator